jgi:hypothetical protein
MSEEDFKESPATTPLVVNKTSVGPYDHIKEDEDDSK